MTTKYRPRLLYIVPASQIFAGIERVVHEIADELARSYGDRLDIHVLYCSAHQEVLDARPRYTTHFVESSRLRYFAPRLYQFFRQEKFDAVIASQCELAVVVWLALLGSRTKLIPYLHGNPAIEEQGSLAGRLAFLAYRGFVGGRAASTLCVAPSLAAFAAKSLPSGGPVSFVPNPVREFNDTRRCRSPGQPFTFLNVGRLSRQKAQDVLIEGYAIARKQLPESALVLVGGGADFETLRERTRALGIEKSVEIVGRHVDPTLYYRSADCFVLASRWEGFGLVLVEALSFGLPLVVTDCDFGPRDLVTDEQIGLVARTEDPESLAAALVEIAHRQPRDDDEDRRRELASRFARPAAARRHFEVLSSIIFDEVSNLP